MRIEQLAINSVSTRHRDLEEALDAYAAAGFRNVEFRLVHVKDWLAQGHRVEDVRRLLDNRGLRCIGGFQAQVECFSEPEARQANRQLHVENAQLIHELGGGTLVVGVDGPPAPRDDSLDVVAEGMRQVVDATDGLDVAIAIEFNWSPLIRSLKSAVQVAEKVRHECCGVLFDPAHYYTTPTKFEDLTAKTVHWIKHVHLDDMRDKPADLSHCNSDRVLPGQGILNLAALIAKLEAHGYNGWYSIEMFNDVLWSMSAADAARDCYQSLVPFCRA